MNTWTQLETSAPSMAQLARERFKGTRVALLGTVRSDGSPRISPIEPYLSQGHLLFGSMSWSRKTRDLLRDPRCVVHSAITAPDAGDPEVKLYGRAVQATADVREGCSAGWWHTRTDAALVFFLVIELATTIEWDVQEGRMLVRRWSSGRGLTETRRSYP